MDYPHCPAAFINALSEGPKEDVLEWLQKTWNELQLARKCIREADSSLIYCEGINLLSCMDAKSPEGLYIAEVTK